MRAQRRSAGPCQRRGATLVLAALLMVAMMGMVAFAVDCGYMSLVRNQLQVAADSAAMAATGVMGSSQSDPVAVAQTFANYHFAGGRNVALKTSDIEYGTWDATSRTFTPTSQVGNALRINARLDATHGGQAPLFFGRVFGLTGFDGVAQAIAMGNKRDICFVVDLSGSMNDDTTTGYGATASYRSSSYPTIYNSMMTQVFSDLNFGSYPGVMKKIGYTVNATSWSNLYSSSGPLTSVSIPVAYRITGSDNTTALRQAKAYKYVVDKEIALNMPNAKPVPNSGNGSSLSYWTDYIDAINSNSGQIGYRSYVTWLMDQGRDQTGPKSGAYGQLSTHSPNCVYHNESTAAGTYSFPASEQPTHSERRSVIAGLHEVKVKNSTLSDPNQMDWVSIITFDKNTTPATITPLVSLTSNYDSAMAVCPTMQAVGDNGNSTATETGLIAAYNLIKPQSQGGTGREDAQKIVILLTDGVANLKTSSNTTITNYESANPSSNYYGGSSNYPSDAALMQANTMHLGKWQMYALALGLAADYDFMDRMARMGGTADQNGHAPTTSGDPATYESEMTALLDQIIDNPQVHLVQ
jgi:hypothetical protein